METGEEEDAYSSPHRIKSTVLGLITNGVAFGLIVLTKRLLLWSLLTFILWLPLIFDDSDSIISHLFYYLFAFVASVAYLVLYLFGNNISAMVLGILISAILAVRSQIQTHGLVHTLINPFIQLFEKVYRSVCAILQPCIEVLSREMARIGRDTRNLMQPMLHTVHQRALIFLTINIALLKKSITREWMMEELTSMAKVLQWLDPASFVCISAWLFCGN